MDHGAAHSSRHCSRSSQSTWLCLLLFFGFGLDLGGCASASHRRASVSAAPLDESRQTLVAYREALRRNDPAAAYLLMAPAVKARVSSEQFAAQWREMQPERTAQLKLLSEAGGLATAPANGLSLQALVSLPQGTALLLVPPSGRRSGWLIADPDLSTVHADTPEQVLRLLVDAVEQRNYFAMLRLLSASERQAIEGELKERIQRLRASMSRRQNAAQPPLPFLEVRGDRAHYQYDPRFFVDLVREKDGWRVLDLN